MPEEEIINLDELRGKPKQIWGLVKNDQLSPGELDRAHEVAFDGEEFDDTNDLHVQMATGVAAALARIESKKEEERQEGRRIAANTLQQEYGIDPTTVPREVLDGIYASMLLQQEEAVAPGADIEQLLTQDNDELVLVDAYDNIIAFVDAPNSDLERRNILEWVGERLTRAQAREAGIQAERQFWLDKINKQYDPQVNKQTRIIARLEYLYTPVGQAYLDELRTAVIKANEKATRDNPKAKQAALPKSVKVGLLTLAYKNDSARVDIVDPDKALAFMDTFIAKPETLRELLEGILDSEEAVETNMEGILANVAALKEIVKTERKVMKSQIPTAVKLVLTRDNQEDTGIFFYAGGVPQFSLK